MTCGECTYTGRPYVKGAFLCDSVIEGKDGTNSYIRVVDRLTVQAGLIRIGPTPPDATPPPLPSSLPAGSVVRAWAVVMLVGGGAKGRHALTLKMRHPSGSVDDYADPIDVLFDERLSSGTNLHVDMNLVDPQEGPYELVVLVEGQEMTRIFFEVVFQRV